MLHLGGYELQEDYMEQYDDVDDFDNIMHRDVDETDNDPDQISAALKSLKKAFPWKNISIASKM